MIAATKVPCPDCGHANTPDDISCVMCGLVLQRVTVEPDPAHGPPVPVVHRRAPACEPHKTTLAYLGLGLALAPLFLLPLLDFTGWFLASLIHETGHCAFAWLAGCPSFPAISLAGHAMAQYSGQQFALALLFWGAFGWLAWQTRRDKKVAIIFAVFALLYPAFAFTKMRDFFFLLGGHLGELAFAGVFFWRALTPRSQVEQAMSAMVGFFLVGRNVWLAGGLLWSDEVRGWYATSGSFGLTNDYIRLARDVLAVDLSVVAFFMLIVALVPLPLSLFVTTRR